MSWSVKEVLKHPRLKRTRRRLRAYLRLSKYKLVQLFSLGRLGETVAAHYLESKLFHIVARNWRCAAGELDLVALHADTLVFVEMKTRSLRAAGSFDPAAAINQKKQERLRRAAAFYEKHNKLELKHLRIHKKRFDSVAIIVAISLWKLPVRFTIDHTISSFS